MGRILQTLFSALALLFAQPCLADIAATYNSATDVPVTASSYSAAGATFSATLNFAPPTGTTLMVVRNTGLNFINGTFRNLVQGQVVTLSYGGINYRYIANYYGGTGNDLVLQWAQTRPVAWGYNLGELGNNTTIISSVPVAVNTAGGLSGKTVVAMATGGAHSLALCSDGTVAAWGENFLGQLGDGTADDSLVPVAVNTAGVLSGKRAVAVAAGENHSLALCSDGTAAAWGYNFYGQLGNNSRELSSLVPVAVSGPPGNGEHGQLQDSPERRSVDASEKHRHERQRRRADRHRSLRRERAAFLPGGDYPAVSRSHNFVRLTSHATFA